MKLEDLYNLLTKFQHDFLSFRHEMIGFKEEMVGFKEDTKSELNRLSQTLIGIDNTLNFYGDMYKINKEGIQALDKRITVLESM